PPAAGKSVFASDESVPPITLTLLPGAEFHRLWGGDEAPTFPGSGAMPDQPMYFPAVGGFRFGLFSVPPDSQSGMGADFDIEAAVGEVEAKLPGMAAYLEPDAPGMHTTDTIDFEFVVSGRVVLELDDGATVTLGPGDTVVQNGTRHAWRNPFDVPCVMVVALVGAHRAS
ncbi:MAG TPA: cupin domain-containing protein, partial [Acidimicrobiales bacterium]